MAALLCQAEVENASAWWKMLLMKATQKQVAAAV